MPHIPHNGFMNVIVLAVIILVIISVVTEALKRRKGQ